MPIVASEEAQIKLRQEQDRKLDELANFSRESALDESLRSEAAEAGTFTATSFRGLQPVKVQYRYDPSTGERIYISPRVLNAAGGTGGASGGSSGGLRGASEEQRLLEGSNPVNFAIKNQLLSAEDPFAERNQQLKFDRELAAFEADLAKQSGVGQPGVQKVETGAIVKAPKRIATGSGDRTGISGRRQSTSGLGATGLGIL